MNYLLTIVNHYCTIGAMKFTNHTKISTERENDERAD